METDLEQLFNIMKIIGTITSIIYMIQVIGEWKLFRKANKPGWSALIPIYNDYIFCTITGVNPLWILITMMIGFIPGIGTVLSVLASIYYSILLNVSIARSFGKKDEWAIGLFFLKPFFMFALGMDSEYQGARPMDDIVFKTLGISNNTKQDNTTQQTTQSNQTNNGNTQLFCSNCGTKVTGDSRYCTNCGAKL